MKQNKAKRNRTIDFSIEEAGEFLAGCTREEELKDGVLPQDCVIIGDCLTTIPRLPKAFADLVIVDPPYNLSKNYHGKKFSKKSRNAYSEYTREWLNALIPVLKPTSSIYVCSDWESSMVIGDILSEYFILRNRITWQRERGRGARANWKNSMEDIWFATVSDDYHFDLDAVKIRKRVIAPYRVDGEPKGWEETDDGLFRDTCPMNFWDDISVPFWSMAENTDHPTQKPEKLYAKLILASSGPGDIVFDPFAGSGTAAVTARKLGRRFVTIERNELYCAWTGKRLMDIEKDPRIQGYEDGVFWERNTKFLQQKKRKKI